MVVVVDSTPPVIPPPARGSLIVGPYDLLDTSGPVIVVNSSDYGSGVADVATVSRLLLDGDIVTGSRTANRQIVLDVVIDSSLSPGGVGTVMANLLAAVDQPLWQITWTPDASSATVVFDCQRGQVTRGYNGGLWASATLTIPAGPFTRDPLPTVLAPPTSGDGAGTLDALATTTGLTGAPAYTFDPATDATYNPSDLAGHGGNPPAATLAVDSAFYPPGQTASVKQTTDAVGETYSYSYTKIEYLGNGDPVPVRETSYSYDSQFYFRWHRAITSMDMTDTAQVAVYAATDLTNANYSPSIAKNAGKWGNGSDRTSATDGDWRLTLYSTSGSSTWLTSKNVGTGSATPDKTWLRILFSLTGAAETTTGTFDITAVTSYRLELWAMTATRNDTGKSVWLSQLDAVGSAGGVALTGPFGLVRFDGVLGAARTPVSMSVSVTGGTPVSRLLIARTPDPPVGFSPILSTPATGTGKSLSDSTSESSSAAMSGFWWPSGTTYTRKALSFNGTYQVMARLSPAGTGNANTLTMSLAAANGGDTQTAGLVLLQHDTRRTQRWVNLGILTLPAKRVDPANTGAAVTFTWTCTFGSSGYAILDMLVLVDLAGDIIDIDLPSGQTCSEFFLDAPGPTDQRGKITGGALSDRSDAIDLTEWSTGLLTNFDPGSNTITMVADNASAGATAQISYYPRWPGERPA